MSLFGKNDKDAPPAAGPGAGPEGAARSREDAREAATRSGNPLKWSRGKEDMANIGKSITIKGDLTGNEDLQIEGNVEGRIDLPNNELTIGAEGKIRAEIHAKAVVVVGHVTGNVSAVDRIEVQSSGIVDGDVRAPRLVVQEGAVLNGAVEMGESKAARTPSAAPPKALTGSDAA